MTRSPVLFTSDATSFSRRILDSRRVFTITLCGNAGAGKTTLLEETLRRVGGDYRCGVIVANPKADRDIGRLRALAQYVAEIRSPHVDAVQVSNALAHADLRPIDLLFIECGAGSAGAAPPDCGQHARVAVFSVSGGDDRAAASPQCVRSADLVLLNKMDLLAHVSFDVEVFRRDVGAINPAAKVLELSASQGRGLDAWERWLRDAVRQYRATHGEDACYPPESFLG